jgi:hypothetical protein
VVETVAHGFDMFACRRGRWVGQGAWVVAAGLGVLADRAEPDHRGAGLLVLILDDIAGYFQGKDSVTGDFV